VFIEAEVSVVGIIHLMSFFVWMFILMGLSFLTDHLLARIASPTAHRVFVGPGVIVHEYSHALACVLTGTKIHEIKLFEKTGGHVTHEKRNPFIMAVIAMAPLFGGILAIFLLSLLFESIGVRSHGGFINLSPSGFPEAFWSLMEAAGRTFYDNIALLSAITIFFLFFLYFVGSIAAVFAPSTADLKNGAIGLVLLFAAGILAIYLKPLSYIPGVEDYFGTPTPALDSLVSLLATGIAIGFIGIIIFLLPLTVIFLIRRR
jgi:hypothetical protein